MGTYNSSFPQPNNLLGFGPPIATDNFGDIYCGTNELQVYKSALLVFVSTNTSPYNYLFPATIPYSNSYIMAMEFNPKESEFDGYVLYHNDSPNIYYRNQSISIITAQQTNPVPGQFWNFPVTCLVTNPNNTQQVWVGQGGANWVSGSTPLPARVQFSPDHGTTWINISTGLPIYLPVTKMVYDEANNVLYAGTDAGIYYCDFNNYDGRITTTTGGLNYNSSVYWSCFNNGAIAGHGFPNVDVTKLVINHCQGKIYAATNGRSVWSSDLYVPNITPMVTDSITTNTTWSTDHYLTGSVYITAGNTLVISNSTLHMPKNGTITVEAGAHIAINYATITNDCSQCLWQGITLMGSNATPQSHTTQGWLTMNHGTIQHAITAVQTQYNDPAAGLTSTGGIVQCINSTFRDNQNDVSLYAYANIIPGTYDVMPNLSYFTNCTFLQDNAYKGDALGLPMSSMVYLQYVDGINFNGCSFLNKDTAAFSRGNGDGIRSFSSSFNVGPWCPTAMSVYGVCLSPINRSRFSGLEEGIYTGGFVANIMSTSIDETDFDTVSIGIYSSSQDNISVTRCNFNIGDGKPVDSVATVYDLGCDQNIGIFIQNTNQFRIEQNSFTGDATATTIYKVGTAITNTGTTDNNIYHNNFTTLSQGVSAIGDNYYAYGPYGLLISCDTFYNNSIDIMIAPVDGSLTTAGINTEQIIAGSLSVANIFIGSPNNIIDNGASITYWADFHHRLTIPRAVSTNVIVYYSADSNLCPSSFSNTNVITGIGATPLALSPTVLRTYEQAFYTDDSALQSLTAFRNSHIDYGNTDSFIHVIHSKTNEQQLFKLLQKASPYISQLALDSAIDRRLFNYSDLMTILESNPDVIRNYDFLTDVQNDYQLSQADMDTLIAYSANSTKRTIIENAINAAQYDKDQQANIIMMALKSAYDSCAYNVDQKNGGCTGGYCTDSTSEYYLLDSLAGYADFREVDTILRTINKMWIWYARAGYYFYLGKFHISDSIADATNREFRQYNDYDHALKLPEQKTYDTIWKVMHRAVAGNGYTANDMYKIYQLTKSLLAELGTMNTPIIKDNRAAQEIINYNHNRDPIANPPPPIIPCDVFIRESVRKGHFGSSSDTTSTPETSTITDLNKKHVTVSPNPTTGMVVFAYSITQNNSINIRVSNLLGEKLMDKIATGTTGTIQWDASLQPAGIYFYQATDGAGMMIGSGKIVVTR